KSLKPKAPTAAAVKVLAVKAATVKVVAAVKVLVGAAQAHDHAAVKGDAAVAKAATAPRKTGGAGESGAKSVSSNVINQGSARIVNPGPGRSESAATAGLAAKAEKAPAAVVAGKPAAGAA